MGEKTTLNPEPPKPVPRSREASAARLARPAGLPDWVALLPSLLSLVQAQLGWGEGSQGSGILGVLRLGLWGGPRVGLRIWGFWVMLWAAGLGVCASGLRGFKVWSRIRP